MKILLIEDDPETADYLQGGLREHGHVVDRAADGREGLFLATTEAYDVLIVDRMLPGLDGLALVKVVRAAEIRTPVLFLTTLAGIDDRVTGLDAGGDDYLVKPFAFSELLARVHALGRRPPLSESPRRVARRRSRARPAAPDGVRGRAGGSICNPRSSVCSNT